MKASQLIVILLSLGAAFTAWRCGREETTRKEQAQTPRLPAVEVVVPADWDGTTDWNGNTLEVVDE